MNIKRLFGTTKSELRGRIETLTGKMEQLQHVNVNLAKRYEQMIKALRQDHANKLNHYEKTLLMAHREHAKKLSQCETALQTVRQEHAKQLSQCEAALQAVRQEHADQIKHNEQQYREQLTQLNVRIVSLTLQLEKVRKEKELQNSELLQLRKKLASRQNGTGFF
ncbi:MAG: hypothetical protein LBJ01_07990 [Tannerella sp.]|jgi:chromosome segregation ATPase|nr:hypothetical protein [Tannerella sp.]